ncbi:hypothetical protein BpHYR1_053643 [Brachionus plicatilis]|uniref:Uncharacterized protein n=1 Tax=Brachionus plicatilis TaxID=10195 RepID=A0A3M7RTB5_BRAPC|nr:hypothetical protein BpHYR1_053643 [Brachionus plicatilis]
MTTLNIQDIRHKKTVSSKYAPNSYRIFCEDIGNESVQGDSKYSHQAPPIYTQPAIVPAQAIEDRNFPHGGRTAGFIRENAYTLNEPVNRISAKNVDKDLEKRWWEWNVPDETDWKQKRRSNSSAPKSDSASEQANLNKSEFQTTYQKDHGYMYHYGKPSSENGFAKRHSFNPNNAHVVGIVPVNDLNSFTNGNEAQKVYVDKMSFEHGYDSRTENNYPNKGKRQGAFVLDQMEPRRVAGTQSRADSNKGVGMWDVMHPSDVPVGVTTPNTSIYKKPPSGVTDEQRRQRRDPIGYFDDSKFGGSFGQGLSNINPAQNFNPVLQANTKEPITGGYQPSWNVGSDFYNGPAKQNDMLENFQNPIAVGNGYHN